MGNQARFLEFMIHELIILLICSKYHLRLQMYDQVKLMELITKVITNFQSHFQINFLWL